MYRTMEVTRLEALAGDVTVPILQWPRDRERVDELAGAGKPMMLLVSPAAAPPDDWDVLTDWIRLPADDDDIRLRVAVLRQRARRRPDPVLDELGVLWRGEAWIALSPVEAGLLRPLLERSDCVLSRRSLACAAWPGGVSNERMVDTYVKRLRRRIPEVGLAIHTVRQRGYLLTVEP